MRKSLILALAAAASATMFAAPINGVITTENGESHKGVIKWSARDKAYVVTEGKVEVQVKADEAAEIDIAKPVGFDNAVAQVNKGQGTAAIPVLQKIVAEYAHLQWDKMAGRYLAEAYISANKYQDAMKACQAIISTDPTAAYKGELAPAYWEAMLKLGQTSQLEKALVKAAATGDRYSSGAALIKRGDMIFEAGKQSPDAAKQALTDGYLRVILLYTEPAVASKVRPEALYKAAICFERLSQASRSDKFRSELKRLYPESPWATK